MKTLKFTLESLIENITENIATGSYVSTIDGYKIEWMSKERNPDGALQTADHDQATSFTIYHIDGDEPQRGGTISISVGSECEVSFDENGYPETAKHIKK